VQQIEDQKEKDNASSRNSNTEMLPPLPQEKISRRVYTNQSPHWKRIDVKQK